MTNLRGALLNAIAVVDAKYDRQLGRADTRLEKLIEHVHPMLGPREPPIGGGSTDRWHQEKVKFRESVVSELNAMCDDNLIAVNHDVDYDDKKRGQVIKLYELTEAGRKKLADPRE